MKKTIIVCLAIIMFAIALVSCEIDSYIDDVDEHTSKKKDNESKMQLATGEESEFNSETDLELNYETQLEETRDYSDQIKRLDEEYDDLKEQIEDYYREEYDGYSDMIRECKVFISDQEYYKERDLNAIQKDITALEKERDSAYSKAVAQTGGYGNSYANTIKAQYNEEINKLISLKNETEVNYNKNIAEMQKLLNDFMEAQESIPKLKQKELSALDSWYEEELKKIYEN